MNDIIKYGLILGGVFLLVKSGTAAANEARAGNGEMFPPSPLPHPLTDFGLPALGPVGTLPQLSTMPFNMPPLPANPSPAISYMPPVTSSGYMSPVTNISVPITNNPNIISSNVNDNYNSQTQAMMPAAGGGGGGGSGDAMSQMIPMIASMFA